MNALIDRLAHYASVDPERVALQSRERVLSYGELFRDVTRVARAFRRQQVSSLGLYLDNGFEWVVIDLACAVAGIRVTPLPWFFSEAQLKHAGLDAAIDHVAFADDWPPGILGDGAATGLYRDSRLRRVNTSRVDWAGSVWGEKLSFTSGTTGEPTGIRLDNRFLERICASLDRVTANLTIDRHLSVLPYSTLLENVAGVYLPLLQGKLVCAEPCGETGLTRALGLEPARLAACINRVKPSSLILTPQLLDGLCAMAENGLIDTTPLRFVAVGGARVPPALIERARAAGIPAYQGYGLTEFGSVAILNTPAQNRANSVGKPLPGVGVEIAADGEIVLTTLAAAAPDAEYRGLKIRVATGDYGHVDNDGFVYIHGRKSNVIVLPSGRNVSPEWVEAELNASPLIRQSFVYARDDWLEALIVPVEGAAAALEGEIERIGASLPAYARIARWQTLHTPFSPANRLVTANGRLRRDRIRSALPNLLAVSTKAGHFLNH